MVLKGELELRRVKVKALRPNPWNPNQMTDSERDKLRREIEEHGYLVPIVVRPGKKKGQWEIVDGEQRWRELVDAKVKEVDVVITSLDDNEARIATVNLNELRGTWREEDLGKLVSDLRGEISLGELAERLPFTTSKLHKLSVKTDALSSGFVQEFVMDAVDIPAVAKRGDIYEVGAHRIMCGDATSEDDLKALMDGNKADMIFTDPPYGADYKTDKAPTGRMGLAGGGRAKTRFPGIEGDKLSVEEWDTLIYAFLGAMEPHLIPGGIYYVCIGPVFAGRLQRILEDAGLHFSGFIVWKKERNVFGRKDYDSQFEFVTYSWKQDAAHRFYGGKGQTDIWEIARDAGSNYIHPTQKPVPLAVRAIENSSKPDSIVLDPFGGSGTTAIAAQHVGRRCYIMDIEPKNVDLIKVRLERFLKQLGEI
jgi:DNA modification methylase